MNFFLSSDYAIAAEVDRLTDQVDGICGIYQGFTPHRVL